MQLRLFTLMFLTIGITLADPVAVTWSADPTVTSQCCAGPYFYLQPLVLNASQNGGEADLSTQSGNNSWNPFPEDFATIEIPFTLTAPAEVAVSVTVEYSGQGSDCGDVSCPELSSWALYGGFSGGISITDENGVDLSVPFGGNGSMATICDPYECAGGLSLSDSESGIVDLEAGTYLLTDSYRMYTESVGDSFTDLNTQVSVSDPSPVPEPSYGYLGFAGMLGCFLFRRFSRRSRR